jgi:hypothetical protein
MTKYKEEGFNPQEMYARLDLRQTHAVTEYD